MRTALILAISAAIAIPLVSVAQEHTTLSCVKDITFSQEFLAKFPRAGAACNQAIMINGQKWVRFNAEVKNVQSSHLTVDFIDRDKRPVESATFAFDPTARVTLDNGQEMSASKLDKGEKLVVWMPESRIGFYAEPGADASKHFALVSESAPTER